MSEGEPLTYGERLEAVYARVAESAPTNQAMRQKAVVGETVLRFCGGDSSDVMVSMLLPSDQGRRRFHAFGNYGPGNWTPATIDTNMEHLAQLVELAEIAEWGPES